MKMKTHPWFDCCLFWLPGMIQSGIWQNLSPQASRATSHTTLLLWPQWRPNRTSHRKHNDTAPSAMLHSSISYMHAEAMWGGKWLAQSVKHVVSVCCSAGGSLRTFLEMKPWGSFWLLGIQWAPSWFERVRHPQVKWPFCYSLKVGLSIW